MPRCLILGVNGQDGSYLAESLLRRGHEVVGIGRDAGSRHVPPSPVYRYECLDLRNADLLADLVKRVRPDHAFHVAAVHGASGFGYEAMWRDMIDVNVLSLHVLLEHARIAAPEMRVIYANSSKIFPPPLAGEIAETSPVRATCLYGIGKIASRDLIAYYRAQHGVQATNLILFNHESPRRPPQFLLPTIARTIAAALEEPSYLTTVRSLDFRIDWSAADELMDIAVDIAERTDEGEFLLASGTTWHGRTAVDHLFARYRLDARRHVKETLPPSDPGPDFHVSLDRLERAIGRRPSKSIADIVDEMIATSRAAE